MVFFSGHFLSLDLMEVVFGLVVGKARCLGKVFPKWFEMRGNEIRTCLFGSEGCLA